MPNSKFVVGNVYYDVRAWDGPQKSHLISSWVYEGPQPSECAADGGSGRCRSSHQFVEWESWHRQNALGEPCPLIRRSIADGHVPMFTWEELLKQLQGFSEFENVRSEFEKDRGRFQDPVHTIPAAILRVLETLDTSANCLLDSCPDDVPFSVRGYLLQGDPQPGMQAVVVLGPQMRLYLRVADVRRIADPDDGVVMLALRSEVESWSDCRPSYHGLGLEGRFMELFSTSQKAE